MDEDPPTADETAPPAPAPLITRRRLLIGAAGLGLGWAATRLGADRPASPEPRSLPAAVPPAAPQPAALPTPGASGIEHVIVVMMENRSFDHFLGWVPGAEGRQAGLTYLDGNGVPHNTHPLAPDFQGCAFNDPDHSYEGGRTEYNNGACDGWLRAGMNDLFSIGYYTQADLPFFSAAASTWTICDHYHAAILSATFPNRFYQHAAQTDRLSNTTTGANLPTIWDRLAAHNISRGYYYNDLPVLALWGLRYLGISHSFSTFLSDCAAGTLPAVSFVDPKLLDAGNGTSEDDHPYADIRNGQVFLNRIYDAVRTSPNWPNTLLIINYDEWGGFFDHVPPPAGPIPPASRLAGDMDGLLGFRVPCLLISPWSPRGTVAHGVYDHTSILKLIEWRWNLEPLTARDAAANNLANALDFANPNLNAPAFNVPQGPFGGACPPTRRPAPDEEWLPVQDLARQLGWPIY